MEERDSKFSISEKVGGSIDLPLPQVGGFGVGNHPSFFNLDTMTRFENEDRGWDVHSSNEMKPAIKK